MSKQYNDKIMKSIYYLTLVLSLSLIGTVSQAQSLAGIQDMVADQPAPLDLVADQTSAQDFSADQISGQDVEIHESAIFETAAYKGLDFFASEDLLELTLAFDIKGLVKSKNKPEYFDATLTVKESDTDSITQHIKVKARGYFRCNFCSFPPLMMKFKNKNSEAIQVEGKTLKLVTHCHQTAKFDQYVLKEYLAYKLLNNLDSNYSFKTRLVRIHYVDINKAKNSYTAYGILIENETMLAKRNNAVIIKSDKFTPKDMNSMDMNRMALFNFMIGNTDWSVQMQHNIKILMSFDKPNGKGIPVVYDFDYSGLVNTYYAAPFEELPIKTVTERYYQGVCTGENELKPLIEEFAGLKDRMLGTIRDFPYLSKNDKKQAESYISSFYGLYRNQNYMISQLNSTCKAF
jgi:hypothetical protein